MKKRILIFEDRPPEDKTAVHVWIGKTELPHEALLGRLIKSYLGTVPIDLALSSTGKPYLPSSPLHFNLSDSEDWLAVAFSWEAPVGIDLETIRPLEGMDQLILNCFSQKEQAYVNERDTLSRFWQIWNRKEACLKALGSGLQDNLSEWDCSGNDWILVNQVWVCSVPTEPNLSAAVAIIS